MIPCTLLEEDLPCYTLCRLPLGIGRPSHERVPAPATPATAVPAVLPRRPAVAQLSATAAGPPSAAAAWRAAAGPPPSLALWRAAAGPPPFPAVWRAAAASPASPALWRAPRRMGRAAGASSEGAARPIHRCGREQEGAWAAAEPTRSYVLRCGFQCVVCTEP